MKKLILALALSAFAVASQADDNKTIKPEKPASAGCTTTSSCCQEKKSSCGEKSGCNKGASKIQSPKGAEQSK
jgi:hypothetical protein